MNLLRFLRNVFLSRFQNMNILSVVTNNTKYTFLLKFNTKYTFLLKLFRWELRSSVLRAGQMNRRSS
jgi:hypothetical protein